jgi:hypothetical protein
MQYVAARVRMRDSGMRRESPLSRSEDVLVMGRPDDPTDVIVVGTADSVNKYLRHAGSEFLQWILI